MKRFLAIVLALLMCVSTLALAACSNGSKKTTDDAQTPESPSTDKGTSDEKEESKPNKPVEETDDDGQGTPNDIYTHVNYPSTKPAEHKPLATLPESFSLVGTDFLPMVDNQGEIGSCASQAITYLQYTNAVAQFAKKQNPDSNWKPARDFESCFSPKWSYQFAGASTGAVYMFLRDHGAITIKDDMFAKNTSSASIIKRNGVLQTKTTGWILTQGLGEQALEYRLTYHEQYWVTDTNGDYWSKDKTEDGKTIGVQFTTSEAGQELLAKIKDAVAQGNVVVTGGYPNTWQYEKLTSNNSTAKKGDEVITHASYKDDKGGGHQVAIVGYDDNIEVRVPGTTDEYMKGAFLIQNSYGDDWKNDGYIWMMYDAVNTVSEFEKFKIPAVETRDWALDQFCFIYWDRDITTALPSMYAELEIETTDRSQLNVELGRTDAYGRYVGATPYMFYYYGNRPTYATKSELGLGNDDDFYFNTKGEVNGKATTAFYTVSFERLMGSMPTGTTVENFQWSIKVSSKGENELTDTVVLKSVVIKNNKGEVLKSMKFSDEKLLKSTNTYVFNLGGNVAYGTLAGKYSFQNVASGNYLAAEGSMTFKSSSKAADALLMNVEYHPDRESYLIWKIEKGSKAPTYVLDVTKTLNTGATLQFNAESSNPEIPLNRAATQSWKFSHNADGTITMYITSEKGTNYALAEIDGVICLKKATALTDDIKWKILPDAATQVTSSVTVAAEGLTVTGTVGKKVAKVKVVVLDMEGNEVKSVEADASTTFTATVDVTAAGSYLVKVLNAETGASAASFTFVTIAA
ncbi:MAG: hypothetical protein J6M12_05535 [Clostridia bacterium]|nr:hypothetical protein [Clostridia bacterium]